MTTAQELLCVSNIAHRERLLEQAIQEGWGKESARQAARGWKAAFQRNQQMPPPRLAYRIAELTEVLRSQDHSKDGQMSWNTGELAAALDLYRELTRCLMGDHEKAWDWRPLNTLPLPFDDTP